MKRIVIYLTASPSDGGKYQYSQSIINALENLDEKVFTLFAVYPENHWGNLLSARFNKRVLKRNNLFLSILKKSLFYFFPNIGRNIWREIGKFVDSNHKTLIRINPDLVIYPGRDPFIHEVKLSGIVPIFDLMHRYENFPELRQNGIYQERELYYKRLCKYSKAILVDSTIGKEHVIESYLVDPDKIHVLPFIPPPYIYDKISKIEIESIKSKYKLPEEFIFYPAQFWLHKNHLGLLESLFILKEQGILVNCVFVGSNYNAQSLIKDKIENYGLGDQITILNYVTNKDILALYKLAVALVMPTFFGPTNIPQLEAFVLGCPVLTSNIYGIPEQVGNAALLFDPLDPNDMALKIKQIFQNPELRIALIEMGKERSKEFTNEKFSERFIEIVKKTLS